MIRSENYTQQMNQVVLPYLQERRQNEGLKSKDGTLLYTSFFTADVPKGTVLLLHGFTENIEKFSEVIYSFLQLGYSVAALDMRGHGRSKRDPYLKAHYLTHVERFDDYLDDVEVVYDRWMKEAQRPFILFSHSMGGAVAALTLEKGKLLFDKAVLNSPMIAPSTGGVPAAAGQAICLAAGAIGRKRKRIFLAGPYTGEEKFEDSCASGLERFNWYNEIRKSRPEFQNSAPTYQWTYESMGVTRRILKKGEPEKVQIPVLIFQASDDNTVEAAPQEAFAAALPKGKLIRVENARHEIYRSGDEAVDAWWKDLISFVENDE